MSYRKNQKSIQFLVPFYLPNYHIYGTINRFHPKTQTSTVGLTDRVFELLIGLVQSHQVTLQRNSQYIVNMIPTYSSLTFYFWLTTDSLFIECCLPMIVINYNSSSLKRRFAHIQFTRKNGRGADSNNND
jgi:hypothetical protein